MFHVRRLLATQLTYQGALILLDNLMGQCTEKLLRFIDLNNINVIMIPLNCTDRLQPLDVSVNKPAKKYLC